VKTIGILGGLGPESTTAYYTYITRKYYETHGDYAYPEILIHSFNFKEIIEAGYKLSGRIKRAIEGLHNAGADFVVAACNSVHIVYEEVAGDIPIPWLSIMDAAGERIQEAGIHTVALCGTVFTMENDFYPKALARYGIQTIVPDPADRQTINGIIYNELVRAEVREESRRTVLHIIDKLVKRGAEGVVLGCTEMPFLIRPEDTPLPLFNTTELHAQKALDYAERNEADRIAS
jgi:aspartate racemase